MPRLRRVLKEIGSVPSSALTSRGYRYDFASFSRWCGEVGRSALPASVDTVSMYLVWRLVECGGKVSTASRHVSAIARAHVDAGVTSPIDRGVRSILSSVRRQRREQPLGKGALCVSDLARVSDACVGVAAARDRCLIILGFATSLRRSELSRLDVQDVSFEREGLAVLVRFSKSDQAGAGRVVAVWAGERAGTDPVRVLRAWLQRRGSLAGPLFCRLSPGGDVVDAPLSGDAICKIVQRAVGRAGLDPSSYCAHSLRAGAVTASAELGRSDHEIMKLSGHKSQSVMRRYTRSAGLFAGRNPLAGAL